MYGFQTRSNRAKLQRPAGAAPAAGQPLQITNGFEQLPKPGGLEITNGFEPANPAPGAMQTDRFPAPSFRCYFGGTFPSSDLRSAKGLDVAAGGLSSASCALTPV